MNKFKLLAILTLWIVYSIWDVSGDNEHIQGDENIDSLIKSQWTSFKAKYYRFYNNSQIEAQRLKNFRENWLRINEHNALYKKGLQTFEMEINEFGDMSQEELSSRTGMVYELPSNGYSIGGVIKETSPVKYPLINGSIAIPKWINWVKKGAVTKVKHQGLTCGSCWAFSATGALEGQYFLKYGKLKSLSEQNLVDCSFAFQNYGCQGGWPSRAFEFIQRNGGIALEDSYPYEHMDNVCKYQMSNKAAYTNGYQTVEPYDEEALKFAVATIGPISIAIHASYSFHYYKNGYYYSENCPNKIYKLNHAVLIVGYGTGKNGEYWLVKNSWGENWGQKGYIKMARNKNNHCGIATVATYPIV